MKNKDLERFLRQTLGREVRPGRMEETIALCAQIVESQAAVLAEPRLDLWGFLSGVLRFEWLPIVLSQAAALFLVGLSFFGASNDMKYIPAYIPLFVLAVIPVLFRGQSCGTSELEAATRSSGAQIVLAKLVLAGAANLVCMTILLWLEVRLTGEPRELGRMILYCLVPYLVCMTVLLRIFRSRKRNGMALAAAMALGSCLFWRASSRVAPGLYELSAVGAWIAAFLVFAAFFAKEIWFIVKANKEGKMYGIVA